jgi:CDP-glucose 4,6-dehydratase
MEIRQFSDCYRNRSVLVTGHTGFKGSWLVYWLQTLGANVTGAALDPCMQPNHWDILNLEISDYCVDIRNYDKLRTLVTSSKPEVVFHLAAQPLVRHSYIAPLENWSTNVMGTANLLEASRHCSSIRAIVVITTDKVYTNQKWHWGYRENDRLGGRDPYSASKSACEILVDSYRHSFFNNENSPLLASARAGNVIGGGDWAADRLIPDAVRAVVSDQPVEIRSPFAIRPWQHVLDCLAGYLMLGEKLLAGEDSSADAWNFGPEPDCNQSVENVLAMMRKHWPELQWDCSKVQHPYETMLLYLDSSKARNQLQWRPVWDLERAVAMTMAWYRSFYKEGKTETTHQLDSYVREAYESRRPWATVP